MLAQQNKAAARKLSKNFGTGTRLSVGCRAAALLSVAAAGSRLRRTDVSAAGKPVAEKSLCRRLLVRFRPFCLRSFLDQQRADDGSAPSGLADPVVFCRQRRLFRFVRRLSRPVLPLFQRQLAQTAGFCRSLDVFRMDPQFHLYRFPLESAGYRLGIQRQRHSGRRAVRNLRAFAFHRHRRRCLGHSVILPRKEKPCFRRSLFRTDPDTAVCIRQPSSRPIPRRELLRRQHPNCPAGHSPANEVETGNAGTKFADLYSNVRSRPCPANRHDHLGRNGQPLCPQFAAAVS